jgi:hypothetical protein
MRYLRRSHASKAMRLESPGLALLAGRTRLRPKNGESHRSRVDRGVRGSGARRKKARFERHRPRFNLNREIIPFLLKMPFTSTAFDETRAKLRPPVPVYDVIFPSTRLFWRIMTYSRLAAQFSVFLFWFNPFNWLVWACWRLGIWFLRSKGVGKGILDRPYPGHELILVNPINILSSCYNPWRHP